MSEWASGATYYTPARVGRFLRSWGELVALAESPTTARNLLYRGQTPIEPMIRQPKGAPIDVNRWADVVADLESAQRQLSSGGLGVAAVAAAMSGVAPSAFAQQARCRKATVLGLYRATVEKMATWLEGGSSTVANGALADA